jgi:Uncharacterized conserved small protein
MATTAEIRQQIAAEVRAEIARQRLSQRQIAEILGMVQPAVQLRLAGTRPFRAEELVQLADALGVPVSKFVPESIVAGAA